LAGEKLLFGKSEGELSFVKAKADIIGFWFLTFHKKLFNVDFEGLTC